MKQAAPISATAKAAFTRILRAVFGNTRVEADRRLDLIGRDTQQAEDPMTSIFRR